MAMTAEDYRDRYTTERPETWTAINDVWNRAASGHFSSWGAFSQAANAEPAWRKRRPELVSKAEQLMTMCGYKIGPPTPRGARRWFKA